MEIQSNISAASLFEGLSQSQTQGTGTKDDAFSKMMDRMISDSIDRKRAQAKDAAKDAQDARAEAKRQQQAPARAERPRLGATPPQRQAEKAEPPAPRETADAKPAPRDEVKDRDGPKDKVRAKDEAPPRKTTTAKTDKPAGKDSAAAANAAPSNNDDVAATDDDAAVAATTDDGATGSSDADAASDDPATDTASSDAVVETDATLTVTKTTVEAAPPASDVLLASLQLGGLATPQPPVKTDGDSAAANATATAKDGAAEAAGTDPAAQLAARLAQAQQAVATSTGQTGASTNAGTDPNGGANNAKTANDGKPLDPASLPTDSAVPTASGNGAATQELPSDDGSAIPTSFADLIAAAKAKMGDKAGGKSSSGDAGTGKSDGQPQAQIATLQAVAPPPPGLEALKTTADSQAVGALTSSTTADAAAETTGAHAGTASQTHAALAAMEAPHAAAQIDMAQATASLRPSRGTAGAPLGVPDQVAVHIKKNVADDVDQFTINLHPAELGRIDIKLDIGADGRVNAMVAVEKAQTLELLQRDSRGLERALQDAGLQTDSNSLNFSLRGDGNQSQGDGNGNGSGKRGRGLRGGAGDEADPGQSAAYTVTVGDGRLDIRA
jgi:flagellar hook-length control protein FliK